MCLAISFITSFIYIYFNITSSKYMNKINIIVPQLHSLFSDSGHKQLELKLSIQLIWIKQYSKHY